MKRYEIVPHTADMRLRVEADSLEGLFRASLEGISEILKKDSCKGMVGRPVNCPVEVSSVDTTALLIDFLSEVLALSYINKAIFCRVEFAKLGSDSLSATLTGVAAERFDRDIKAVTYHKAEIRRNEQGNYQTDIVMDI